MALSLSYCYTCKALHTPAFLQQMHHCERLPHTTAEEADNSDAGRARAEMMRLTRLRAQLELVVTRLQKDKAAFEAYKVRSHCLLSHPSVSSVFCMLSIRKCCSA